MQNRAALLTALLISVACAQPTYAWNAAEDEARIEVLIKAEREAKAAKAPTVARAAAPAALLRKSGQLDSVAPVPQQVFAPAAETRELAYADVRGMLGKSVEVRTKRGHQHTGTVETWSPKSMTLGVNKYGGKYSFELKRSKIARVSTAGG